MASGIAVAGITSQAAEGVAGYLAENPLPFPILSDPERQVIQAYGVYHLIGFDAFRMARPAAFYVNGSGQVSFIYVGAHQADHPSTQVLAAAAANLLPRR